MNRPDTATGRLVAYIPAGPDLDELLGLVRIGLAFKGQQVGKRPGFLRRYICALVGQMEPPVTFNRMLDALELEAVRRNLSATGKDLPPIERVNRAMEHVTYHDPTRGRVNVTFGTLRNIFTRARVTGAGNS